MIHDELEKLEKLSKRIQQRLVDADEENVRLNRKVEELNEELKQKEQEIEHFKNKIKISNIVDNRTVNPEDSTEMRELINNYIHEIDHLITYLSE